MDQYLGINRLVLKGQIYVRLFLIVYLLKT